MGNYILLVFFVYVGGSNPPAMAVANFRSQTTCEQAGRWVAAQEARGNQRISWTCIPNL